MLDTHREALLAWFDREGRTFPWRGEREPYRIWVRETMLQQTRAAAVGPYLDRFLATLPTLPALAAADASTVLRLWEGLGYYRRPHALAHAARLVVQHHGSRLPAGREALLQLPGVGPYTADALLAFAFGRKAVPIDANVRRLGARLLADPAPRDGRLADALAPLLPRERPQRAAEALIELGATVCLPRTPRCQRCPLAQSCRALAGGDPQAYPARARRSPPPLCRRYAALAYDGDRVLLRRRPTGGMLAGLWGPPQSVERPSGTELAPILHAYSHFRLELVPVLLPANVAPPRDPDGEEERAWFAPEDLAALPHSKVDRTAVARAAEARQGPVLGSGP